MLDYAWLIPLFPLTGVLVNATLGRKLPRSAVAAIACLAVGASFAAGVVMLFAMLGLPAQTADGANARAHTIPLFSWIVAGRFQVGASLLLDQLSMLMVLVVTGVSTLIHVYSAAYMRGEEYYKRYFTWLNLFVFMMLVLVLGDSFLTLYVGWEGVGLCSYLLIGYWFERESAANAAKKAFIVNRVGDFGFALGILLIFATFGSLAFADVFPAAKMMAPGAATAIALLLFLGATAKSAQIPLYVWLPDAMEGPTPVSALIHAATMVTAGVYMVARCYAIFERSASALHWVAWVGLLTALFAATMALLEKDFKRILAYSTISQLGYMFVGVGVGAYSTGLFQLTTHSLFKALLFLCAGSVMHALAGETNIFKMGGLRRWMPWTFGTVLVAVMSISGVPMFSGFFSKDEILHVAFVQGGIPLGVLALLTAGLGGFYAFRLLFVAFCGRPRLGKKLEAHIHESPWMMIVPMVILGILDLCTGYLGLPRVLGLRNWIDGFLHPVFAGSARATLGEGQAATQWLVIGASLAGTLSAVLLAYWLYIRRWGTAERWTESARWLYDIVYNKYYVDRAYQEGIVKPLRRLAEILSDVVEPRGVDGTVNGVGRLLVLAGQGLRRLQTGRVRSYALFMLAGVVAVLFYFLVRSLLG